MKLKIKIEDPRLYDPPAQAGKKHKLGYETPGSAAIDLRACGTVNLEAKTVTPLHYQLPIYPGDEVVLSAGFKMALPGGTAAHILPRSGLSIKSGIVLSNLVGVVDEDFRDVVCVAVWYRNRSPWKKAEPFMINPMMRVAQMMIVPVLKPEIMITPDLDETERFGGFGHTGVA